MQRKKLPEELFKHLENRIKEILETSYLLGCLHIQEIIEGMNLADFDYERVIQSLLVRITLPKQEFYALEEEARFAAFTISRLLGFDAIERVKEKLAEAIREGMTITEFIEKTGKDEILQAAGFHASNPWYWETVFRTNVQAAYQAGRMRSIWRHAEHFPYLEYIAVLDERTTDICRELHGTVAPVDDPVWDRLTPPNHFNCRSVVRPVTRYEVKEYGIKPTPEERLKALPDPQEGFAGNPAVDWYGVKETMRERLYRYGLLEAVEKEEKKLKKQGVVASVQGLHKRILSGDVGGYLGGETFVARIRRMRKKSLAGCYDFGDQTLYIHSKHYKDLVELLPALLAERPLKGNEAYALMGALRTYLHEVLHAFAPSLEIQRLRGRTYLRFRALEEALVTVGEYHLFPSFVKFFLGWNFEAFRSVYAKYKYLTYYENAAVVVEEMCSLIAKRRGIPIEKVVTECLLSGAHENWIDYFTAEILAARSEKVAEFLDAAKTKYGNAVYQHVREVFREAWERMRFSWERTVVRWEDKESFYAGLRGVEELAEKREYVEKGLEKWERLLGGMRGGI